MARNSGNRAEGPTFNRRHFLEGALAASAAAIAAGCGSSATVSRAATTAPAGSDLGAIEHVVFLMQENRSFDHYFGSYKGVRGFDDHPDGHLGAFAQPLASNTTRPPIGRQLPFHLDTRPGSASAPTTCHTAGCRNISAATMAPWMPSSVRTRPLSSKGPATAC